MRRRLCALLLALLLALSLAACGEEKAQRKTVYAMDTVMNLTAYGADAEAALIEAETEIYRLDALLSRQREGSDVSALNRGETLPRESEVYALLTSACDVCTRSGGAFDPTVAPILDAWGFGGEAQRVPPEDELSALLSRVGLLTHPLMEDGDDFSLAPGTQIDLGGIAKGYAADRVAEIFRVHGCTGTVDLGGDLTLVGQKQGGQDWRIAVKDPNNAAGFLCGLAAADCAVVTSGVYERYFEQDGRRYHHIIDPATGYPAESGLVSATVVCASGAYADALSTAVFVLGAEKALALYQSAPGGDMAFEMLLLTQDGRVLYTPGLSEHITPNEESGYTYERLT